MDTLLIAVTLISLALAGALALLLAKLLREERRRSDARVAALTELAVARDEPGTAPIQASLASARPARSRPDSAVRGTPQPVREVRARHDTPAADLEIRRADVAGVADLFAPPEQASPWGRRLRLIGGIAFVAGAGLFAAVHFDRTGAETGMTEVPVARAAPAAAQPLELLSLRYAQQANTLTISGVVQNPRTGAPLQRLVATALVFAPDGTLLADVKAPLDFTTLAAGDESPFVLNATVSGPVARYRVGFRTENGNVIAHVDRRNGETIARTTGS